MLQLLDRLDDDLRSTAELMLRRGLFASLCALLVEGSEIGHGLGVELVLIERMALMGRWSDLLAMVAPLGDEAGGSRDRVEFLVLRQQFLESLHWQQGCATDYPWAPPAGVRLEPELDVDLTVGILRRLEVMASENDFSSLCLCLSLDRVADHPDLESWSVAKGRVDCSREISSLLSPLFGARPAARIKNSEVLPPSNVRFEVKAQSIEPLRATDPVAKAEGKLPVSWTIETDVGRTDSAPPLSSVSKRIPSIDKRAAPMPPAPREELWSSHKSPIILYHSSSPLRCLAVLGSLGGRDLIAVGSNAHNIHVISRVGSDCRVQSELLEAHRGSVYCLDWRSEGECSGRLVSGSNDKTLRMSRVQRGEFLDYAAVFRGHTGTIRSVAFSPRGTYVVSGGAGDYRPRLWDPETAQCVVVLDGHEDTVHGLSWLSEQMCVSACEKGLLTGHDLRSPSAAWRLNLDRSTCSLASMEDLIIAGCTGGWLLSVDATSLSVLSSDKIHSDDIRGVCTQALPSNRGPFLALSTSFDASAQVLRVEGRKSGAMQVLAKLTGHTDKVLGGKFTEAEGVITTGADGKALLWQSQ